MLNHFIIRGGKDFIRQASGFPPDAAPTRDDAHLAAAIDWLRNSIDQCGGDGSSKGYRFLKGWMPPYPETTGYIIPTLLTIASGPDDEWSERAKRMANWLADIQLPNGGFAAREFGHSDEPDVFDTGMILLGFNSLLHEEDGEMPTVEAAAAKAAGFLVSSLDANGAFARHLSHGILHTYNVRAAWGLLAFGLLRDDERCVEAGMANAHWTLRQQNADGYYENNGFKKGGNANTHGIAYVMQGLLQIHDLTSDRDLFRSVVLAADALTAKYLARGMLPGELGPDWSFLSNYICLTGYAQLAIVLFRLYELTGNDTYRSVAEQLLEGVKQTQDLDGAGDRPQRGAIAGSFPIYGRYAPLQYPNWATKFFVDALLAKRRVARREAAPGFLAYGG
jgi:hypothetical protein